MAKKRNRNRRASEKPGPAGFLVVDKPPGRTSHDVVDAARKWFGTRRVGHLGTLDPQATGVLPLAIREATKLISFIRNDEKSYVGTIHLGVETDTLDAQGTEVRRFEGELPGEAEVEAALEPFRGEIEQIPPMYSAVKQAGVPLHRIAREGREVERAPKSVHIDRLEILSYREPLLEIEVDCSPGTYVRTLADDLGTLLGCGAHLESLRRTRSGPFVLEQATPVEELADEAAHDRLDQRVIPPVQALGLPIVQLGPEEARRVLNGCEIGASATLAPGGRVAALEPGGDLLAVMEILPGRRLHPIRVLPPVAAAR
jgi:tRNA pseudouridine55 synthase